MAAKNYLAAIHIAKKEAQLSDTRYRLILHKATGVDSCSGMSEDQLKAALIALKAELNHKPGWQQRQINKLKQYANFCGMNEVEYRRLIQQTTGWMNEESPQLDQDNFDDMMAEIERELAQRIKAGVVTLPKGININYWRNRHPNQGKCNSRQIKLINDLWQELCEYLTPERRKVQYLHGLIALACRMPRLKPLHELSKYQAVNAIEALKLRIEQEQNKRTVPQYPSNTIEGDLLF